VITESPISPGTTTSPPRSQCAIYAFITHPAAASTSRIGPGSHEATLLKPPPLYPRVVVIRRRSRAGAALSCPEAADTKAAYQHHTSCTEHSDPYSRPIDVPRPGFLPRPLPYHNLPTFMAFHHRCILWYDAGCTEYVPTCFLRGLVQYE
jgi:hypothetical protein